MAEKLGTFDAMGFYSALDATRRAKGIVWKDVAHASGVSASTLTRMAQGKRPDVDSLAALAAWSGLKADDYVVVGDYARPDAEPLALISTYLRADKHLTPTSAAAIDEIVRTAYEQMRKSR